MFSTPQARVRLLCKQRIGGKGRKERKNRERERKIGGRERKNFGRNNYIE